MSALCWKAVLISEGPSSEVPLYSFFPSTEDVSAENSSHDLIQGKEVLALELEGNDEGPIVVLTTGSDTELETDC